MKIRNETRFRNNAAAALTYQRASTESRVDALRRALQELEPPSQEDGDEAPSPRPAPPVSREELALELLNAHGRGSTTKLSVHEWLPVADAALSLLGMGGEGEEDPRKPELPDRMSVMEGIGLWVGGLMGAGGGRPATEDEDREAAARYNAVESYREWLRYVARCPASLERFDEFLAEERQKVREGS